MSTRYTVDDLLADARSGVSEASVTVDGERLGEIGPGLVALIGVTHDDTDEKARVLARKLYELRIFDTPDGERSAADLSLGVLVISQFTLYGDTRKGRRPSWLAAAPGNVAAPLVDGVVAELRQRGAKVETGRFGADMKVALVNDGPITILLEV